MEETNPGEGKSSPYLIPGAIVVAGVLIAGAVIYSNSLDGPAAERGSAAVGQGKIETGDLADNDPMLGNPEAPVTLVEFGDYQCPFCQRFFLTTEKEIIDTYVKTGKARFVYRDFPLTSIHEMAQSSAEASECANEQGKFWPYHDILYSRQDELSALNLKLWASEIGLDRTAFDKCLDSGKYFAEVEKDLNDGQSAGVSGTPATFVNGRLISGAVSFAQFKAVIEEELKKAR